MKRIQMAIPDELWDELKKYLRRKDLTWNQWGAKAAQDTVAPPRVLLEEPLTEKEKRELRAQLGDAVPTSLAELSEEVVVEELARIYRELDEEVRRQGPDYARHKAAERVEVLREMQIFTLKGRHGTTWTGLALSQADARRRASAAGINFSDAPPAPMPHEEEESVLLP